MRAMRNTILSARITNRIVHKYDISAIKCLNVGFGGKTNWREPYAG